jgi:tyrosyl-tRNA synthetase
MQAKNREQPTFSTEKGKEAFGVITRDLHSWIDAPAIAKVLDGDKPLRIYWGTATTGRPHLGYFVPIIKLGDFLKAGCHVTILFANLHGFLDNMKSTFEVLEHRCAYYEVVIREMLTFMDVPLDRLTFVKGTDYQLSKEYTLDMYKLATCVTTEHTTKAGAEVVKQVSTPNMSNLMYPILQALDEEYLKVDVQFGGVDQRKLFMFAREKLPHIGYRKRAYLMNPLIPGLGKSGKMSSSEPLSKVELDEEEAALKKKIKKAYSVDGEAEGNGLLAILQYIIFRRLEAEGRPLVVPRHEKFGGPMTFETFEQAQEAFGRASDDPTALLSGDLKAAVIQELSPFVAHFRTVLAGHQDLIAKAYPEEKKAAAPAAKGGKGKAPAADAPITPGRLDIRVGKVVACNPHESAEHLLVSTIDVGEAEPRTIVSGLAKFVKPEDLAGTTVVVLCNLKASNLRGVKSFGMVLCASSEDGSQVEVLRPPTEAKAGDRIVFESDPDSTPDETVDTKKKHNIWNGATCPTPLGAEMRVDEDGVAKHKDSPYSVAGGVCTAETLRSVTVG